MTPAVSKPSPTVDGPSASAGFTPEQKEYLTGFMAGIAQRGLIPYDGLTPGGLITGNPGLGGPNLAEPAKEETIFGFLDSEELQRMGVPRPTGDLLVSIPLWLAMGVLLWIYRRPGSLSYWLLFNLRKSTRNRG